MKTVRDRMVFSSLSIDNMVRIKRTYTEFVEADEFPDTIDCPFCSHRFIDVPRLDGSESSFQPTLPEPPISNTPHDEVLRAPNADDKPTQPDDFYKKLDEELSSNHVQDVVKTLEDDFVANDLKLKDAFVSLYREYYPRANLRWETSSYVDMFDMYVETIGLYADTIEMLVQSLRNIQYDRKPRM